MNKNITIKVKSSKLKELGEYLISIGEEVNSAYYINLWRTDEYVFVYNSIIGWDWSYYDEHEFEKCFDLSIDYNTFMRQVKLERILK